MEPIKLLAIIVVFLLLILLAAVSVSRRRGERMERKIDAIMQYIGMTDVLKNIDGDFNRRSSYAPLQAEAPGPAGYSPPPPSPRRPQ